MGKGSIESVREYAGAVGVEWVLGGWGYGEDEEFGRAHGCG